MQYKISEDEYVHGGIQKDFYSEGDVESSNCLLCNSASKTSIYKERGHIGIVQCNDCGLIYTSPRPKEAEQNYFGDASIFYEEARFIFKGTKPHHRDKNYEYEIAQLKQIKSAGKLLDIGTNMGFFLRKAREAGYDVEGVEPAPALAEIARKEFSFKIKNSYFKKEDFAQKSFDIITLVDVFEHITSPVPILKDVYEVLKDDGIVCIKVPNGNYNKLKLKLAQLSRREQQHELFNGYEHVVHYTIMSMNKMASKANFKIKKVIIPLPINPPVWANLTGHYFQYPSPFILDWKRIITRKLFYYIGKIEKMIGLSVRFAPDLMFILEKQVTKSKK
jgi:2-polyprenyl-3-methyl-5-hydroxy-6-metoxy-1,4-benzoquinol methylase